MSVRLHLAALVILAAVHYGTREESYKPGDEATLAGVLDRPGAQKLVELQAITPAVLGDPDALPGRAAFVALGHDALEFMALEHDVTPLAIETGDVVTVRDLVDALLAAGVAPPALPPAPPAEPTPNGAVASPESDAAASPAAPSGA